eukprot:gene7555-10294_t
MSLQRINKRDVKWVDIFQSRAQELNRKALLSREERNFTKTNTTFDGAIFTKEEINHDKDVKNALPSSKLSLDNLKIPKHQNEWQKHWVSQTLCSICSLPALTDCIVCKTCDVIFHSACVDKNKTVDEIINQEDENSINFMQKSLNLLRPSSAAFTIDKNSFYCSNCEETIREDYKYYEDVITKLREKNIERICSELIKTRFLIYIEKIRLKRKKTAVIKLQAMIRCFTARSKFNKWRINQYRVVEVEFIDLPSWCGDSGLVIISGVDTSKNTHLFRFDKAGPDVFHEKFLIPGVNNFMTLIFTFALKEDHHSQTFSVIGQSHLIMKDAINSLNKQTYHLKMTDKIKSVPLPNRSAIPSLCSPVVF